jgi:hypothetical protein
MLLILVLAAVSTLGAVYFLDFSEPAAESTPTFQQSTSTIDADPPPFAPTKCGSANVDGK